MPALEKGSKPNDYLQKLALVVSTKYKEDKKVPDNVVHASEVNSFLASPDKLAEFLEGKPHLQEQLAYLVDFSPSRWLLAQEIPVIRQRRLIHEGADYIFDADKDDPYDWARKRRLRGICFSGGGIRSATLNLGILQGLAELDLLSKFDYLSSVSGGGYIHEWFAAWVRREGFDTVQEELKPLPESGQPFHPEPIRWLRRYSNYLTPRKGFLTGDTWVAVAIWFRNTFLNQMILISSLFFLLHLPNVVAPFLIQQSHKVFVPVAAVLFLAGLVCITVTLRREYQRIQELKPTPDNARKRQGLLTAGNERTIQVGVIFPLLLAGLFYLNHLVCDKLSIWDIVGVFLSQWALIASIAFAGASLDAYMKGHGLENAPAEFWAHLRWRIEIAVKAVGFLVLANAAIAAAGGTFFFWAANWLLHSHLPSSVNAAFGHPDAWRFQLTLGPALLLAVSFLSLVLGAGLIGRDFRDWLREWLGRVRAWALLFGILWAAYFGIALLGPYLFKWSSTQLPHLVAGVKWTTAAAWVVTSVGAILAGQSSRTSGSKDSATAHGVLAFLITFGPHVFILGLLLVISQFAALCAHSFPYDWKFWLPLVLPLFIFLLFGFRVDINDFSMNPFYRNRLTRCYLGASNKQRDPNPLTGFDDRDTQGMQMSQLVPPAAPLINKSAAAGSPGSAESSTPASDPSAPQKGYVGPFPIICTTINLTFGQDLAWQERKAASFAFTPLYSGYHVGWTAGKANRSLSYNGFVPTRMYAVPKGGINMATAVAISGAAASPNWGYHTNPAIAFLLTMFNVRLGWWLFNPRRSKFAGVGGAMGQINEQIEPRSPLFAPVELAKELLGMTNDASKYVYLSDGGHFDNMGLYELVRRRCYRIVICDAEQDEEHTFGGIASAIRKCRIDFGVEITLDLSELRPNKKTGNCKSHYAIGTIRYPETPSEKDAIGKILYLKSSLTGVVKKDGRDPLPSEPTDILNYRFEHAAFPHDTTANQWFTESQFESYRRLGHHIIKEIELCQGWADFK